jgi:iduronate 2-sulfatase
MPKYLLLLSLAWQTSNAGQIQNVLLLVSDDLKASVLGCYGDKFSKTPNIDRLARKGVVFEKAYCQGTVCGPSRQSFMFSRYKGRNGASVAEHFKNNGWHTARVGKIFHMRVPGDIIAGTNGQDHPESWSERYNSQGLESHTPGLYACLSLNHFTRAPENRQSTKMPQRPFVTVESDDPSGRDQPDYKTASTSIELLEKFKGAGQKFFLASGFVRPHYPMVAPAPLFRNYPWQSMPLPNVPDGDLDDIPPGGIAGNNNSRNPIGQFPDNQKRMWAGYYASVEFMDEQVGRVLDKIDALGLDKSTAIVFTSDHGYHLGEHTFWEKGNLHEEVTRVPLIISLPGMEGASSRQIVELMDIYPTLANLSALDIPASVQGVSLVPILDNPALEKPLKPGALSFVGRGSSLRVQDWHYARYDNGGEELYDMSKDPGQYSNLVRDPTSANKLSELRNSLTQRLKETQ